MQFFEHKGFVKAKTENLKSKEEAIEDAILVGAEDVELSDENESIYEVLN